MINPKTPKITRDIIRKNPELAKIFGWDMDAKLCNFKPKYKVGDIARVLVMSNPDPNPIKGFVPQDTIIRTPDKIRDETDIFYAEVEITGYYKEGYGCLITRVIYSRNDDSKFDVIGQHHCYHRNWFMDSEIQKKCIETIFELPEKVTFT